MASRYAELVRLTAIASMAFLSGLRLAATPRVPTLNAQAASAVGPASNTMTPVVGAIGEVVPPTGPIVLTGRQSMVILSDVVFRNDIVVRDDAVLTIRKATFTHANDFSGQYSLHAYDRARVIVDNATIKSSSWVNWQFFDDASLLMTNVVNRESQIWSVFSGRARVVAVGVSRFWGTVSEDASFAIDGAEESFLETVYPKDAVVDERFPQSVGSASYVFPNAGDAGQFPRLELSNITTMQWGITYGPGSSVTITDTNRLVVTLAIDRRFSGLSAEFSNLRAQLYADQTWTTAGATLRLVNTTTLPWSPLVSGSNSLTVRDSELADFVHGGGDSNVLIVNCSMSFVRANDRQRITLIGSTVSGDVVATGNSTITLSGTRVLGQIVRLDNGQISIRP